MSRCSEKVAVMSACQAAAFSKASLAPRKARRIDGRSLPVAQVAQGDMIRPAAQHTRARLNALIEPQDVEP